MRERRKGGRLRFPGVGLDLEEGGESEAGESILLPSSGVMVRSAVRAAVLAALGSAGTSPNALV